MAQVKKNYCPCCGEWSEFIPGARIVRPRAICGNCICYERHRLLYLFFDRETDLFLPPRKDVAEFCGMAGLSSALKRRGVNYFHYGYPDVDLQKCDIPDNWFDVVLTVHVIAEIPDKQAAMREIYRMMRPGGWGVMQSNLGVPPYPAPIPFTKDEYRELLRSPGFNLEVSRFAWELTDKEVQEDELLREDIYIVRKPR